MIKYRSGILINIVLLFSVFVFVPVSKAEVVADSVDDFGSTQGGNGWTYELDNNGAISNMTWSAGASEWVGSGVYNGSAFTLKINATSQSEAKLGGGATQGPASRRVWTLPKAADGSLTVSGSYNITASSARVQLFSIRSGVLTHEYDLLNGSGSGTYSRSIAGLDEGDSIVMRLGPWTADAANEVMMAWNMTISGSFVNSRSPANGAINVPVSVSLEWFPESGATTSYDLYLGADPDVVSNSTAGFLAGDVDGNRQVDFNDIFVAAQQWLTDPDGEDPSANLNPDDIVNIADFAIIAKDWKEHSAYVGNFDLASNSYTPGDLELFETYYWRVDEIGASGTVNEEVWSFTTGIPANLQITVGTPFTIVSKTWAEIDEIADPDYIATYGYWGFWNFPSLRKCTDGSLLLYFHTGEDAHLSVPAEESLLRSYDNGATWEMDPMAELRPLSPRVRDSHIYYSGVELLNGMGLAGFCNLSDGNSVAYRHTQKDISGGPNDFVTSMWRSSDGGATWSGPTDANVTVANMDLNSRGSGPSFWYRSVELSNGDLVTTAHTRFIGDTKLRAVALGSSDKGYNWNYLGTVAYDPAIPTQGFVEPIVCKLADDELISLMRTEGHQPMYQAHSTDGGVTWSTPIQSGVNGVAPDMRLLSNGVLACSYGRTGDPHNNDDNIMFSVDGGQTWTDHTLVFPGSSTGYASLEEISPGRLLYVFDTIGMDLPSGNPRNGIRGVYIDVDFVYE